MSLAGRHNSFCCDFAYNRHNDLQMGLPAEGGWKEKRLLCVFLHRVSYPRCSSSLFIWHFDNDRHDMHIVQKSYNNCMQHLTIPDS